MATYTNYATPSQVATFMGKTVDELPADIDTLIANASDLITNTIIVDIEDWHSDALVFATCAQVEYIINGGNDENTAPIKSYSAGSVSVTFADGYTQLPLCARARGYLSKAGLLYRGVSLR